MKCWLFRSYEITQSTNYLVEMGGGVTFVVTRIAMSMREVG